MALCVGDFFSHLPVEVSPGGTAACSTKPQQAVQPKRRGSNHGLPCIQGNYFWRDDREQ